MVAALGDLKIRVVARRQFDALLRDQVDEGFVLRRQIFVHRGDHFFVALRAGDLEHLRMPIENFLRLRTQAAGDDHLAVLGQRFADGIQRFVHGGIDEAAGVDYHEIGGGDSSAPPHSPRRAGASGCVRNRPVPWGSPS